MPRKIAALTLAGARKSELAGAWARLGFALDPLGDAITLADGVALAFFAAEDATALGVENLQARAFLAQFAARLSGAALLTLEASAEECRAEPLGGADCYVTLAPSREATGRVQPNGVTGLKTLVAVVENPADHAEHLAHLTGQREMLATSAGLEIALAGGTALAVLSPLAFAFRFGFAAPESAVFRLAGAVFRVGDVAATHAFLERKGVEPKIQAGRLIARPGEGAGVAVAFEQD
jgi:hypothetical protein